MRMLITRLPDPTDSGPFVLTTCQQHHFIASLANAFPGLSWLPIHDGDWRPNFRPAPMGYDDPSAQPVVNGVSGSVGCWVFEDWWPSSQIENQVTGVAKRQTGKIVMQMIQHAFCKRATGAILFGKWRSQLKDIDL